MEIPIGKTASRQEFPAQSVDAFLVGSSHESRGCIVGGVTVDILGVLLVGALDFNFSGFYMNYNKEAKSLTFRRGSEVSQVSFVRCKLNQSTHDPTHLNLQVNRLGAWENPDDAGTDGETNQRYGYPILCLYLPPSLSLSPSLSVALSLSLSVLCMTVYVHVF